MSKLDHRLKRLESGTLTEAPTLIAFVPKGWEHRDRDERITTAAKEHGMSDHYETMIIETAAEGDFRAVAVHRMSELLDTVAAESSRVGCGR